MAGGNSKWAKHKYKMYKFKYTTKGGVNSGLGSYQPFFVGLGLTIGRNVVQYPVENSVDGAKHRFGVQSERGW